MINVVEGVNSSNMVSILWEKSWGGGEREREREREREEGRERCGGGGDFSCNIIFLYERLIVAVMVIHSRYPGQIMMSAGAGGGMGMRMPMGIRTQMPPGRVIPGEREKEGERERQRQRGRERERERVSKLCVTV